MYTPYEIATAVARAFHVPLGRVVNNQGRRRADARLTWIYLCVQFLPAPKTHPARNGHTRTAGDKDGNIKPTARRLNLTPSHVRYALARVEDLRDDPEFDALVASLEEQLQ